MDETNPFASPMTGGEQPGTGESSTDYLLESRLAGRGTRLVASIVDGLLMLLVTLPLQFYLPPLLYPNAATLPQLVSGEVTPEEFEASQPGLEFMIGMSVLGMGIFLLMHGYLLANNGQTIGKKLLGVKIVRSDETPATLQRIVVARLLPVWIVALVPVVGGLVVLVDSLLIFRASRQCLHDNIADTIVVKA